MAAFALPPPGLAGPLDGLRGDKRVLVVFAGDETAARQQRAALPPGDLAARDMVVLFVPRKGPVQVTGEGLDEPPSSAALRRQFEVAEEATFVAVLVGKDGGVKARETAPISAASLFGLIDAMPMRRQEMRKP